MSAQQPPTKTDWRTVHRRLNPDMLFAEDLGGKTRVDVEIVNSALERVKQRDGKYKDLPILYFRGAKKKLGCGATICKTLTTLTGTRYIEDWRGWITLIVVKTTYRDQDTGQVETTDAIRVAPRRPSGKPGANQLPETPATEPPIDEPQPGEPEPGDGYAFDPDADKGES